jgi:hypothetical protein
MITEVNVDGVDIVTAKHTVRIRKTGISVFLIEEPKEKGGDTISVHEPIYEQRVDLT